MLAALLNAMIANKVDFCLQHQASSNYFNLSVTDSKGRQHTHNGNDIKSVEAFLEVMWGHLLKPQEFKVTLITSPDGKFTTPYYEVPPATMSPPPFPRPF